MQAGIANMEFLPSDKPKDVVDWFTHTGNHTAALWFSARSVAQDVTHE